MGLRYRFNLLLTLIMLVFIVTLMFVMMTSSKNSILEGVSFKPKEENIFQVNFAAWNKKIITVELTLAPAD